MESAAEYTKRLLRQGAQARKSLGQNFLTDEKVIRRIVEVSGLRPDTPLVEIGPGLGVLTRVLAQAVNKIWAVELDRAKVEILKQELKGLPVEIIHADALQLSLRELWGDEQGFLIGNLPYYITSPLLMHFLEQSANLTGMTVMVQKEVADRLSARPGGRTYGVLTIAVQSAAEVEKVLEVPAQAFWPPPKVTSAVVRLMLRPYPGLTVNREALMRVVRAAFSQRRKTIGNSLAAGLGLGKDQVLQVLVEAGIGEQRRAETVSIEEFQVLAKLLQASTA